MRLNMPATQTASHLDGSHPADGNPPSFESVWAALQETDRIVKETARQMQETDRHMQETDKRFGKLNNRFGEIVEYMVAPNLRGKFRELGLNFPKANPNSDVSDYDNNIFLEIDVMLENGDKALLVEVKTKLTTEDVKDHIARLEKMRKYADLHGDKRTFLGAVAGIVMTSNVKEYALGQGFYVIEPSGETFNITPPSGKPKEW
ncbi:MAG: hypothetical protein LBQ82_09495 [Treponema sp.]|nr:hypothetical protein [Treponema sp.]